MLPGTAKTRIDNSVTGSLHDGHNCAAQTKPWNEYERVPHEGKRILSIMSPSEGWGPQFGACPDSNPALDREKRRRGNMEERSHLPL